MPHTLVVGSTLSGKSTLCKRIAQSVKNRGVGVIVLDPVFDSSWPCDFKTANPDEFLRVFWNSQSCVVFIDEAGDAVGKYNDLMRKTATAGRHVGHRVFFITQRAQDLNKTVRDQCHDLFLFMSSKSDGKMFADEFVKDELRGCNTLGKGEYFACSRFKPVQRLKLKGF